MSFSQTRDSVLLLICTADPPTSPVPGRVSLRCSLKGVVHTVL